AERKWALPTVARGLGGVAPIGDGNCESSFLANEEMPEEDEIPREPFSDELRTSMFRPIRPDNGNHAPISIYEIGVVYGPEGVGKYGINSRKLKTALRNREADVKALFTQENGILPKLCEILPEFLERDLHEMVHAAALRFLNECRRLMAIW
ncbi:MAG: hypothetical protein FWF81_00850, partial [Defluviitaleaceae bacterium]|nr:hypothetical protein [Defluviitaleaceae bacterium]